MVSAVLKLFSELTKLLWCGILYFRILMWFDLHLLYCCRGVRTEWLTTDVLFLTSTHEIHVLVATEGTVHYIMLSSNLLLQILFILQSIWWLLKTWISFCKLSIYCSMVTVLTGGVNVFGLNKTIQYSKILYCVFSLFLFYFIFFSIILL